MPATVATSVQVEGEQIAARNLVLTLGKSKLTGDLAIANSLLAGKLALNAPDLKQFKSLAGLPLAGALSADITLEDAKGRQSAQLSAKVVAVSRLARHSRLPASRARRRPKGCSAHAQSTPTSILPIR